MRQRWFVTAILAVSVSLLAHVALGQPITEFSVPTASSGLLGITAAFDGNLWFTEQSANKLGRITTAGVITEFPLPVAGTQPARIITGPDGGIWFTETGRSFIGHISSEGSFSEIPLSRSGDASKGITAGPDGAVWFAQSPGNRIGRIGVEGVATAFLIPTASSGPSGITAGPDGNLWFTENAGNKIGRITTAGVITEFPLPTPGSGPFGITLGPDGNLWFTERTASKVGRITTAGAVTEFPVGSGGESIRTGADGNLWFDEDNGKIGRMTPSGIVTEFAIPAGSTSLPEGIAAGPDGNIWFTEFNGNKIGRITTGAVSSVLPVVVSAPGVPPSFFKTSAQLHNPTDSVLFGAAVFHPQGIPGTTSDPTAIFGLRPHETIAADDILPELGQSGIGTLDLIATTGPVPVSVIRIFNDAGAAGTTGFNEEQVRPANALSAGSGGVLVAPADLTRFRFNIGVRTLGSGASMTITVRDKQGNLVRTVTKSFGPTFFVQGSASDFLGAPLAGGESLSFSIDSGSAVVYGVNADNITQDPSLQLAAAPSTAGGMLVLPVVLSAPGALGSFFKTEVQVHNASAVPISGQFVFHPSGVPGTSGDPSLPYSLAPYQTVDFADLLPAMGQSGVGTLDLLATVGPAPLTVTRIYNDAGAAGTTGFNEDQIRPEDALTAGQRAVLIAPIDVSKFRFNIGVRTLSSGASISVTVRDQNGAVKQTVSKSYPAVFFQQGSDANFLGAALSANDSIEISVNSGSLIVYGATADNTTQDPSLQLAKKVS
jgi:virginiamycin B lyase